MQVKKSTFKVLFYLKKNAPKKNGKVAIMGRITIDGKIAQFSTKIEIFPDKWDLKFGKVLGKSEEALSLNHKLEELKTRLINQYDHLMKTEGFATAEKLKNSFLGIGTMASAFAKVWRRNGKKQIILLSCHYDIIDWLQPDWVYDTREGVCRKKSQAVQKSNWIFSRRTAVTGSFLNRITI
ncbi:Arm DNA-binding domain-containing protein [Capnocytophaga canimorsus]|uniref:Arm DNA-binding domain-containing protein n=1 Tax=Capnocytophaga canimorsus TaxID=28188 RepID=UPI001E47B352|nr:Arm DNA-binding domain-containing protein [Capnocytophaga canimorsus]